MIVVQSDEMMLVPNPEFRGDWGLNYFPIAVGEFPNLREEYIDVLRGLQHTTKTLEGIELIDIAISDEMFEELLLRACDGEDSDRFFIQMLEERVTRLINNWRILSKSYMLEV